MLDKTTNVVTLIVAVTVLFFSGKTEPKVATAKALAKPIQQAATPSATRVAAPVAETPPAAGVLPISGDNQIPDTGKMVADTESSDVSNARTHPQQAAHPAPVAIVAAAGGFCTSGNCGPAASYGRSRQVAASSGRQRQGLFRGLFRGRK